MIIPKFQARNTNGKILIKRKEIFNLYTKTLPEDVYVTVTDKKPTRSHNQNRYYHGVVVKLLSINIGYSSKEMHEVLKSLFLQSKFDFCGKPVIIIRSTTDLTTTEMEEYLTECREWAWAERELSIPLPNECEY